MMMTVSYRNYRDTGDMEEGRNVMTAYIVTTFSDEIFELAIYVIILFGYHEEQSYYL